VDPLWSAELEELPDGSFLLVREISKALSGEPFSYFAKGEKKQIKCESIDPEVFFHYITTFNNCENFGLPHGTGWSNELPWLLFFLTHFKYLKSEIESWHYRKK